MRLRLRNTHHLLDGLCTLYMLYASMVWLLAYVCVIPASQPDDCARWLYVCVLRIKCVYVKHEVCRSRLKVYCFVIVETAAIFKRDVYSIQWFSKFVLF